MVALSFSRLVPGVSASMSAIAPGLDCAAIDVPEKLAYDESLAFVLERTFAPGATTSGLIGLKKLGPLAAEAREHVVDVDRTGGEDVLVVAGRVGRSTARPLLPIAKTGMIPAARQELTYDWYQGSPPPPAHELLTTAGTLLIRHGAVDPRRASGSTAPSWSGRSHRRSWCRSPGRQSRPPEEPTRIWFDPPSSPTSCPSCAFRGRCCRSEPAESCRGPTSCSCGYWSSRGTGCRSHVCPADARSRCSRPRCPRRGCPEPRRRGP